MMMKKNRKVWGSALFLVMGLWQVHALAASQSKAEHEKKVVPAASVQAKPQVEFKTSLGDFTVELDTKRAPKTVANFLRYVKEDFYAGTIFHRVIPNFMIQGGGFTEKMKEKATHAPIPLEADNGLKNVDGSIAMARTSDPNSATSQFFINVVDNTNLDAPKPDGYGYAVFGTVIKGMGVVKKIEGVPTEDKGMYQNVPKTDVIIRSTTLLKTDEKSTN